MTKQELRELAEKQAKDILDGWCLPGMTVGWQIKNGCLEGQLKDKIESALIQAHDAGVEKAAEIVEIHTQRLCNCHVELEDCDNFKITEVRALKIGEEK